ncbi:hypothetical protein F511_29569 [Dorcoceras hygrometricum]|uniref:Uncharacterized protein n=1 Tax=Dorcoceras hygrometricum TaxID=472368 RepID=A0A2Z7BX50_9LAMI|nr:hypothetical protein F511_29569 [Dorcoceras hygrometricum]
MLGDIFKIPQLRKLHEQELMVNGYIYNRPRILSMMRELTDKETVSGKRVAEVILMPSFLENCSFCVESWWPVGERIAVGRW